MVEEEEREDLSLTRGTPLGHLPGRASALLLMQEKRKTHSWARQPQHLKGGQRHRPPSWWPVEAGRSHPSPAHCVHSLTLPASLWSRAPEPPSLAAPSSPLLFPGFHVSICFPHSDFLRKVFKGSQVDGTHPVWTAQSTSPSPSYPPPTECCQN